MINNFVKKQLEEASKKNFNELEIRIKFPLEFFEEKEKNGFFDKKEYIDSLVMVGSNGKRRESFYKGLKKIKSDDIEKINLFSLKLNEVIKISFAHEKKIEFDFKTTQFLRFKRRFIFKEKNWTIFYTKIFLCKEISKAKDYLDKLFSNKMEFNQWEFEVELKDYKEINSCLETFLKDYPPFYEKYYYLNQISQLYFLLKISNKTNSLKKLVNNPIPLDKKRFSTINLNDFLMLDKSDGKRCLLRITNGVLYEILEGEIKEIGESKNLLLNEIIIDCEKIKENYYCFDLLFKDNLITSLSYEERLNILKDLNIKDLKNIFLKEVSQTKEIEKFYNKKRTYEIDGLIFVNKNKDYWAPVYKWKPPSLLTFDLLVLPENLEKSFVLMCGLKSSLISKVQEFPQNYKELVKNLVKNNDSYIPVPISTKNYPKSYLYFPLKKEISTFEVLEKKEAFIGEFIFKKETFELIKVREDKTKLIKEGVYGNDFIVLEELQEELKDPLTIEDLDKFSDINKSGSSESQYFVKSKSLEFRAPIKFNSFVKFIVLSNLENSPFVIDIAAGKGQDLFVYHGIGVKKVLMVEPDLKATLEIEQRKKLLFQQEHYIYTTIPKSKIFIEIVNKSFNEFLLESRNVKDADIVCNFALHYLLEEKKDYLNFAEFCKGAKSVSLTFFDKEVLKKNLPFKTNKFHVEESKKNKILVKHHFADEFYEENLVDSELLINLMEKKGFRLVRRDSFSKWFDNFKNENFKFYNLLTEEDKKYCSFYQYLVFYSKK